MMQGLDSIPDYCCAEVLVLGCGNVLLGDDGFGPAVIERILKRGKMLPNACFINAGTSVRELLFNIVLSEIRPKKIIVVDCMEFGGRPGEVRLIPLETIPKNKTADFSMHQLPTSNLLRELQDNCNIEILLIACQPQVIKEEVCPGLSDQVQKSLKIAEDLVLDLCNVE